MTDFTKAFEAAKQHARGVFPEESCGLIVDGNYIACENVASPASAHIDDPDCGCRLCSFEIDGKIYAHHSVNDEIQMIVHSHPNGPYFPSQADMEGQVATNVPWAIIALDLERCAQPVMWGGDLSIPPVIGRPFMHGVTDCYSLVRDCYRLGKTELEKQDIAGWPFDPITLMEKPREDNWWNKEQNLYEENFLRAGFVEIDMSEAAPGDVFLTKIRSPVCNHAGVLVGNSLIVHHLPSRLSRREPAGLWGRQAVRWLRYIGPIDA